MRGVPVLPTMLQLGAAVSSPAYRGRWLQLRLQILVRDRWRCYWCKRPANTVDHVQALAEGGTHDPANLVAACRSCNARRGGETAQRLQNSERPHGFFSGEPSRRVTVSGWTGTRRRTVYPGAIESD